MNRILRALLPLLLLGGAVMVVARREAPRSAPAPTAIPPAADPRAIPIPQVAAPASRERAATAPAPSPASLRGTEPDGALPVDARGHLRVGPEVRRFFDYFLTATGEEPPGAIRTRIVAAIRARLPPVAAAEAIDLLDRYLAYRERARALAPADPAADLEARMAVIRALRREALGDRDAEALFADEEERDRVELERRRILEDPRFSPGEKERQMEELDARLPPEEREAHEAALAAIRLRRDEALLRARGASAAEIHALRASRFGPEAADRLDALDRERAAWTRRVEAYRRERSAILSDARLSPAERERAIGEMLERDFTPPERIRVRALDAIPASPAAPAPPPR